MEHPFGTDRISVRNLLARMLYGGRISLAVGFAAMTVAIIGRNPDRRHLGHFARQCRRRADVDHRPVSWPCRNCRCWLLVIYLVRDFLKNWGRPGRRRLHSDRAGDRRVPLDAGGAIGGGRSSCRCAKRNFVEAARALGATTPRLVIKHILPNALGPVIVSRHHRRCGRDHRGIDAVVSRPRLSAGYSDLGRLLFDAKDYLDSPRTGRCCREQRFFLTVPHDQFHRRRIARRARSQEVM